MLAKQNMGSKLYKVCILNIIKKIPLTVNFLQVQSRIIFTERQQHASCQCMIVQIHHCLPPDENETLLLQDISHAFRGSRNTTRHCSS